MQNVHRRRLAFDLDVDPARHDEERTDQHDERNVFVHRVRQDGRAAGNSRDVVSRHRGAKRDGDVRIIMLPDVLHARRSQRHRRNQEQQQPERHEQPQGNRGAARGRREEKRESHAGWFVGRLARRRRSGINPDLQFKTYESRARIAALVRTKCSSAA
jgi:hypothetical protein